jgi:TIGR03009 family protein
LVAAFRGKSTSVADRRIAAMSAEVAFSRRGGRVITDPRMMESPHPDAGESAISKRRNMRRIALLACLLLAAPAMGQNAPLPKPGPELDKLLDGVLGDWEKTMSKTTSLAARLERVTEDKIFQTKDVYTGTAKLLRAEGQPLRASLHLVKADNPKIYEKLVLNGTSLYEFAPASKEIRVHTLPEPKPGQNVDPNLLGLIFGMKADQAKARYKIELSAADANYLQLCIESKTRDDKADFGKAVLALARATLTPRQLIFVQPNGNRTTWNLPVIDMPTKLGAADFDTTPPAGWKLSRVPGAERGK